RPTPAWSTCATSTTSPSSTGWRYSTSSRSTRTWSPASPSRAPAGSGASRRSWKSSGPSSARRTRAATERRPPGRPKTPRPPIRRAGRRTTGNGAGTGRDRGRGVAEGVDPLPRPRDTIREEPFRTGHRAEGSSPSALPGAAPQRHGQLQERGSRRTGSARGTGGTDQVAPVDARYAHPSTGVRRLHHLPLADVDAHMVDGVGVGRVFGEEDEVSWTQGVERDVRP